MVHIDALKILKTHDDAYPVVRPQQDCVLPSLKVGGGPR